MNEQKVGGDGNLQQHKQALRKQIRAEMQQIPDDYFLKAGQQMCRRVLESEDYRQAKTIFCFVSHGKEPNTYPLLEQALADGKTLCVPLCKTQGEMDAKVIHSLNELQPGAYGIPEPGENAETLLPSQIDLAVIPCLAASRDGKRLGKGGGYYDRFLAAYTGKTLLLCPEKLIFDTIPTEPHDILLPKIITEKEA